MPAQASEQTASRSHSVCSGRSLSVGRATIRRHNCDKTNAALLDAEHGPFQMVDPPEDAQLNSLSTATQTLVARGASSDDYKEIYCERCNFTTAKSLDQVIFDGAYLTGADFAHVSLRGTSFRNAHFGGTNFFGADLTKADLSKRSPTDIASLLKSFCSRPWSRLASKGLTDQLPLLECAKLNGADLSGQPPVFFVKRFDTTSDIESSYRIQITLPRMTSVQIDTSTKLDTFAVLIAIVISDNFLKNHTAAPVVQPLTTHQNVLGWEIPLAEAAWAPPDFQRIHFGNDGSKDTWTIAKLDLLVDALSLKSLGKDAFMLRGFIDQPELKTLPLYSRFIDTVRALSVPETSEAKVAQAWSDKAIKTWATMEPQSCSGHPDSYLLLFDLGDHSSIYPPGR